MSENPLTTGQRFPDFSLKTSNDEVIQVADYRQRRNLVLAFIAQSKCADFLVDLASRHADFDFLDTDILIVTQLAKHEVRALRANQDLPFKFLLDDDGAVHASFAQPQNEHGCAPTVYVIDRFGEIFASYPDQHDRSVPSAQSLLDWLQYIELQCPE